jgi:hypothetical protein
MTQDHIDEGSAAGANFPPAAARPVAQAQTMVFDSEKLLVQREEARRLNSLGGSELALGVLEDFILMQ